MEHLHYLPSIVRTERASSESSAKILWLVDQFPAVPDFRINLGNGYSNYGELPPNAISKTVVTQKRAPLSQSKP